MKFHFNISDIFAALMINFFVCRVGSPSSCHGYQPPPAPAAFSPDKIIEIFNIFFAVRTAGNIRKLLCWSALSKKKEKRQKDRKEAGSETPHRHFFSNGGRLKLNFDIIFKVDFFFPLDGDEVAQQWCYNRKHIDIIVKSLPTFCLRHNYHSLRRNVNIVFARGGNMEFLYLK